MEDQEPYYRMPKQPLIKSVMKRETTELIRMKQTIIEVSKRQRGAIPLLNKTNFLLIKEIEMELFSRN